MPFPLGLQMIEIKPYPKLFVKTVENINPLPKKKLSKNKKRKKNKSLKY